MVRDLLATIPCVMVRDLLATIPCVMVRDLIATHGVGVQKG